MIHNIIIVLAAAVVTLATAVHDMVRDTPVYINRRQLAMGSALLVVTIPVVWAVAALAK